MVGGAVPSWASCFDERMFFGFELSHGLMAGDLFSLDDLIELVFGILWSREYGWVSLDLGEESISLSDGFVVIGMGDVSELDSWDVIFLLLYLHVLILSYWLTIYVQSL